MKIPISITILFSIFAVSVLAFTGCRDLDPSGTYKGDQVLYHAELSITTSYDLIHAYVAWEKENRNMLTAWPEIRQSADAMRKNAPTWFSTAHALRDAYAINPTDENQAALKRSLSVLAAAVQETIKYMTLATQPK